MKEKFEVLEFEWGTKIIDTRGGVAVITRVYRNVSPSTYEQRIKEAVDKPPSMLRKAANFTGAAVKHAVAGSPLAPDVVVTYRWSRCLSCDGKEDPAARFFVPGPLPGTGTCNHEKCGCGIRSLAADGDSSLPNKLRWYDQECPLKRWLRYQSAEDASARLDPPSSSSPEKSPS